MENPGLTSTKSPGLIRALESALPLPTSTAARVPAGSTHVGTTSLIQALTQAAASPALTTSNGVSATQPIAATPITSTATVAAVQTNTLSYKHKLTICLLIGALGGTMTAIYLSEQRKKRLVHQNGAKPYY
jgi:beta-lactamase regulating signal transducer with metallopeptidase domain